MELKLQVPLNDLEALVQEFLPEWKLGLVWKQLHPLVNSLVALALLLKILRTLFLYTNSVCALPSLL